MHGVKQKLLKLEGKGPPRVVLIGLATPLKFITD